MMRFPASVGIQLASILKLLSLIILCVTPSVDMARGQTKQDRTQAQPTPQTKLSDQAIEDLDKSLAALLRGKPQLMAVRQVDGRYAVFSSKDVAKKSKNKLVLPEGAHFARGGRNDPKDDSVTEKDIIQSLRSNYERISYSAGPYFMTSRERAGKSVVTVSGTAGEASRELEIEVAQILNVN